MRVEHWTNAAEQGAHAARSLLAAAAGQPAAPYAPVPFFWSDQYGQRIQFLGRAGPDDEVRLVSGSVEDRGFVALYGRAGRLRGVLGLSRPKLVMPYQKLLPPARPGTTPWPTPPPRPDPEATRPAVAPHLSVHVRAGDRRVPDLRTRTKGGEAGRRWCAVAR